MSEVSIHEVAGIFGKRLSPLGQRSFCPLRIHKRGDKSFSVFKSSDGKLLWKCHSCDPPSNAGDAVKLYALLSGMDRRDAWRELRDKGYEVPGARSMPDSERRPVQRQPVRKAVVPIEGRRPPADQVVRLAPERWNQLSNNRLGAVEAFSAKRGLAAGLMRELDVVDVDRGAVGFGYRNPENGEPCRVKVRAVEKKTFWIEPRAPKGESGVALSPLYLAHRLAAPAGLASAVVITEGEVDALSLASIGVRNAVSLPDGCSSAANVDLRPVWSMASIIFSAVDADDDGDRAHRDLYLRCQAMRKDVVRVRWSLQGRKAFKDANEALLAGWTRSEFVACLQSAANELRGYEVNLASAC